MIFDAYKPQIWLKLLQLVAVAVKYLILKES